MALRGERSWTGRGGRGRWVRAAAGPRRGAAAGEAAAPPGHRGLAGHRRPEAAPPGTEPSLPPLGPAAGGELGDGSELRGERRLRGRGEGSAGPLHPRGRSGSAAPSRPRGVPRWVRGARRSHGAAAAAAGGFGRSRQP